MYSKVRRTRITRLEASGLGFGDVVVAGVWCLVALAWPGICAFYVILIWFYMILYDFYMILYDFYMFLAILKNTMPESPLPRVESSFLVSVGHNTLNK